MRFEIKNGFEGARKTRHSKNRPRWRSQRAEQLDRQRQTGKLEEDIKTHIAQLEAYNKLLDNILKNHMAGIETCHQYIKESTGAAKERFLSYQSKFEKDDSEIAKYPLSA